MVFPMKFCVVCTAIVSITLSTAGRAANVDIALVVRHAPGANDQENVLPASELPVGGGPTFFVELWAQTSDPNGLSQVSADIVFDPASLNVVGVDHTVLFDFFPCGAPADSCSGGIDNIAGLIDNLSGSHFSPGCLDPVGVQGTWARVAIIEMAATAGGSTIIQSSDANSPAFVVSTCGSAGTPVVQFGSVEVAVVDIAIELVAVSAPGAADVVTSLPVAQQTAEVGATVFLELWVQTFDNNGIASVAVDIQYDPSRISAISITHTALFNIFPCGAVGDPSPPCFGGIDNGVGLIDNLSGSHLSPACADQVGLAPLWARVAIIEMQANGPGTVAIQSGDANDVIFVTVNCASFQPPAIGYGAATLTILGGGAIPTVSAWGSLVLALLLLLSGTILLGRRAGCEDLCGTRSGK